MTFGVDDFHALVRLLQERPEWRTELRRLVLADELLAVPEQIDRLHQETDHRFAELAGALTTLTGRVDALTVRVDGLAQQMEVLTARVDTLARQVEVLTARVDALAQQMEVLTARVDALARQMEVLTARVDGLARQVEALTASVDALTAQMSTLTSHVAELRGESLENRYRRHVYSYFAPMLRRAHVLTTDEMASLLEDAIERGTLAPEQAHELSWADIVVRGRSLADGSTVHLVVEVSVGIGVKDVHRAVERSSLLERTGVTAVPVVAGQWTTPEATEAARAFRVWQVTDGRVEAPGA